MRVNILLLINIVICHQSFNKQLDVIHQAKTKINKNPKTIWLKLMEKGKHLKNF